MPTRTGRRSKLTPALAQAIVTAIAGGIPYYQACLLADVSESTATDWRARGDGTSPRRHPTPALVAFVTAVKKAEAQDEARRLLRINQAGQGGTVIAESTITYPDGRVAHDVKRTTPQWQADAWHLERKYPDRYGKRLQADLHLQIQQAAQEVADEIGIDVSLVLREAQAYLLEEKHDAARKGR